MAVPKKKTSKSKRNMRRSHHALGNVNVVENTTSGELTLPHHISSDGFYKGRKIFEAPETNDNDQDGELAETL